MEDFRKFTDMSRIEDRNVFGKFAEAMKPCNDTGYFEVENFSFNLNPMSQFFYLSGTNSVPKHFSEGKACALMAWYLKGNRDDTEILKAFPEYEHKDMNTAYVKFNSNYGFYLLTQKYLYEACAILANDINSRRASISINNNTTMFSKIGDKLCTNNIMFRIRDGRLNMTVQMRSNDIVRNMVYDIFTFCMFYGIAFNILLRTYPALKVGVYNHTVASMHFHTSYKDAFMEAVMYEQYIGVSKRMAFNFYDERFIQKLERKMKTVSNIQFNMI